MRKTIADVREERGKAIARVDGHVKRIDENYYKVRSQSGNGEYDVRSGELGWICSCPDFAYRGQKCKHIHAVEFSLLLRKKVASQIVIQPVSNLSCPNCKSDVIVRHGIRHNKYGDLQRFSCKECMKRFTINIGFEGMRSTPQIITSAMQLYFTGESFRNVQKFLKLQGVRVSHMAVYKWIKKYVGLMQKYLEDIQPNVSDVWRADELYVKIRGNMKYLYALMDDETRFWIAQQVSDSKNTSNVRPLFQRGKEVTGSKPSVLITDGAPNFHDAYKKEFWTIKKETRTEHVQQIRLQGQHNNNKMERFNGEVRDREKVMRGLKRADTPILTGYQIYHNYLRLHEGLNGKTPAEACGIKVEGENKWVTLIQNGYLSSNIF